MKQEVTLTEQEVNQALLDYASKHGVRFEGMTATVTVVAGRGDRGVYATIALEPASSQVLSIPKNYNNIPEDNVLSEIKDEGVPVEDTQEIDDEDEIFG